MILHEMEVTSMEVDLINCCNFQQFLHIAEECLNMYIHSDISLNPLVVGFNSLLGHICLYAYVHKVNPNIFRYFL